MVWIPPPLQNYESRNTVMRDKMSDTKVHVTDEQPWVAGWGGQHNPDHTKMHTGRDENVHVVHHTNVQNQASEQEHWEREKRKGQRIKDEGGKRRETKRKKREGWGKQRKRESENVSGLKIKSEKKEKKKKLIFHIKGEKKKIQQHIKAKAGHRGENYTMLTRWWLSGGWVGNALDWKMN